VGSISFVVPAIDESMRVRLHVRLRDRNGKIIARNTQLLSFFPNRYFHAPRRQEPLWVHDPFGLWELEARLRESGYNVVTAPEPAAPGPRFAVVSRLDKTVAEFLEAGGNVLYLVHSAEEAGDVPELKNLRIRNRRARADLRSPEKNPWEGDWVTNFNWLKHDPLFDRIPRTIDTPLPGDLMDFQYARVIPNQVMLGWSQAEDFNDVFCGMVVGWIHSPASILAQCRWGEGKLLATTLKLESAFGDDPVAPIQLQNLLRYLTSSRFKPTRDIRAARPRRSSPASEPVPAVAPG
jgi:hypothetical protein